MLSTYSSSGPFWHVLWHVLNCGFAFRDCFPQSRLFESWCKIFQWCRLSWQRSPLHCNGLQGFLSKDVLASCSFDLYSFMLYVWCSFPGFSLLLQPLVMSKYIKPPTWKKAVPWHFEDCSIIPSYLPLICCKFSGWLCKRLPWASPAVQWGDVLPKK